MNTFPVVYAAGQKEISLESCPCYLTNALKRHCVMTHTPCVGSCMWCQHLLAASQIHFTECIVKRGQIPKCIKKDRNPILHWCEFTFWSPQETTYQISKFTPALVFTDNQEMQFLTKENSVPYRGCLIASHKSNLMHLSYCQWDKHSAIFIGTPMCLPADTTKWCFAQKTFLSMVVFSACSKPPSKLWEKLLCHFWHLLYVRLSQFRIVC